MTPTNEEMDVFILSKLPATFGQLSNAAEQHFGIDTFRQVDRRLQSLRKRGLISFQRVKGKGTVWSNNLVTVEMEGLALCA
jgi:hypothetical protein